MTPQGATMPARIGRFASRIRSWSARRWAGALGASTFLTSTVLANAQGTSPSSQGAGPDILGIPVATFQIVQLVVVSGALIAAFVSAFWLIKERGRTAAQNEALRSKLSAETARSNQLATLSAVEGQRAIIWPAGGEKPFVLGRLDARAGAPDTEAEFLAFGRWLAPTSAAAVERAVRALRSGAKPFVIGVETKSGTHIEAAGRTSAGSAIVRFSNLSAEREQFAQLAAEHRRVVDTLTNMQALLDRVDLPFWLRDKEGDLAWANAAYVASVDCTKLDDVVTGKTELFGVQARKTVRDTVAADGHFAGQLSTVVNGDRVIYAVTEENGPSGTAGLAVDKSEVEAVRTELSSTIRSHEETLNELTTAVAMFDATGSLLFHNNAFQELWGLDGHFLASKPTMGMFLDLMREEGRLPEMPEWRRWKNEVLDAFKAIDPQTHMWHLPDRRTLRVFANPHPRGGMTWIFENLTERINLESRYKTMERVQGETLDHLAEGVAVFASDGYLKLANPAFGKFWSVSDLMGEDNVHISSIVTRREVKGDGTSELWDEFAGTVTNFGEDRINGAGRIVFGETTLSWMCVPLPNGQTMLTFVDMTAADQIERALRERNDALEQTAEVRNRIITHVSHELRAPLTTIKGFTDMLLMGTVGALTDAQSEYVAHIASASGTLAKITDDIVDLATIDAGVMELDMRATPVAEIMEAAAAEVAERFEQHRITLTLVTDDAPETVTADPARLQRVFANVLNNAADFAPDGTSVAFSAEHDRSDGVLFRVLDQGPGISAEAAAHVFEPFHTDQTGRQRGAGLGLALVKSLVALHGGD
ncbi:MAG: PAS-domain containing protein, partial [Pseudomonadota bacterium]